MQVRPIFKPLYNQKILHNNNANSNHIFFTHTNQKDSVNFGNKLTINDVLNDLNKNLYEKLKTSKDLSEPQIISILKNTNENNIYAAELAFNDEYFQNFNIAPLIASTNKENKQLAEKLLTDRDFPRKEITSILMFTNEENILLAERICSDTKFPREEIRWILRKTNKDNIELADEMCKEKDFPNDIVEVVLNKTNDNNKELVENMIYDKKFPRDTILNIINSTSEERYPLALRLVKEKKIPALIIPDILDRLDKNNIEFTERIYNDVDIPNEVIPNILDITGIFNDKSFEKAKKMCNTLSSDQIKNLSAYDLIFANNFLDLYKKTSIDELSILEKKAFIKALVENNFGVFRISPELSKEFTLLPKDDDEYSTILHQLNKSVRTVPEKLPSKQIKSAFHAMNNLSLILSSIPDKTFAKLEFKQDYPKNEFITDTLHIVEKLTPNQQNILLNKFGFEIIKNPNSTVGYSIIGYPTANNNGTREINNIKDVDTQHAYLELEKIVKKFTHNNKIHSKYPLLDLQLNKVIEALPEMQTTISKEQHATHDFDIFKHSLKLLQKIRENENFDSLNTSDKTILLLASLLHDISKNEGEIDRLHDEKSSLDALYISKKFNLTKDEELKLYTLIKHHEWLKYVNSAYNEKDLNERLQSIAYDLHHGNIFELSKMFTHADLKAVKSDNSFHDKIISQFNNLEKNTLGEKTDIYSEIIEKYITDLKSTQPFLPQTKFPKASRINQAITNVNVDGSTNIKGVYKDKDGLIIIKYNEVEEWDKIGFPKGSISKGISITSGEEKINTGNIKFFVHGLSYKNHLAKFDVLTQADSDALLSVSYAERPESKYRFFKPQGVLLDVNPNYIHGGGVSDAGSGFQKSIKDFKKKYLFGGYKNSDRTYISDTIKINTGLDNSEYIDFTEQNKDKPIPEIEPKLLRSKILKTLSAIQSKKRYGERAYNEILISNPNNIMGVYAYNVDPKEKIGNPIKFLNREKISEFERNSSDFETTPVKSRTDFLRKYALEKDLPFVVFGD